MFYEINIVNLLQKHYQHLKPPKKKIKAQEKEFAKNIIMQIEEFCKKRKVKKSNDSVYQEFMKSELSQRKYCRKAKISRSRLTQGIKNNNISNIPKTSKYDLVKESAFKEFSKMRQEGKEVHYWHLQNFSKLEARRLNLKRRCSSLSFVNSIKKKYGIVGRKVTVKRKANTNEDQMIEDSNRFVSSINEIIRSKEISPSRVFNADQTGLNYEISTQRTLEIKNTKHVHSIVKRNFGTTHSYTLQIYMNQSGSLGKTLYLILREPNGIGNLMKRRIKEVTDICKNVKVVGSSSGHINDKLLSEWMDLFKGENQINDNSEFNLLLWDDFTLQRSKKYQIEDHFQTETLPPDTTKYCQPLDTRFNLQYKKLYRRLYNDLKFLTDMNKYWIIKLNSIVYNQLSNEIFSDLVKYSWKVAGYENEGLDECIGFRNVVSACFTDLDKCANCENQSVLKCCYCKKELCFDHLILKEVHLHL